MDPDAMPDPDYWRPLHEQLTEILRARIARGDWQPGRPIPSEPQLVQIYGVARGTVRHAVGTLVDEGLLITVRGRGTFVREP